jgi:RHS repeat-associated protein
MPSTAQNTSLNYYPFGSAIESRAFASGEYRFGLNGMEKESENNSGAYDFGARMCDTRLGRWQSLDPMQKKYAGLSPFNAMLNCPIVFKDVDGKDVDDSKLLKNKEYVRGYELFANTEIGKKFLARFYGGRENYINCTNTQMGDMSQHMLVVRPAVKPTWNYNGGNPVIKGDILNGAAGATSWGLQMKNGSTIKLGKLTAKDIEKSVLKFKIEIFADLNFNLDDPLTFGHEAVLHVMFYIDRMNEVLELYSKEKITSQEAANRLNSLHGEMGVEGAKDHDKATSKTSNKFQKAYDAFHNQLRELVKNNPDELTELNEHIEREKKDVKEHANEKKTKEI